LGIDTRKEPDLCTFLKKSERPRTPGTGEFLNPFMYVLCGTETVQILFFRTRMEGASRK
jgi:hypothetical protein